ncbi:MAG: energy-coupling factor transporter transmembrane protein EcfT [Stappiaceae bacterium]
MIALYLAGRSWAHRLPAGLKLLVLAVASVLAFPIDTVFPLLVLLSIAVGLFASLGKPGLNKLVIIRRFAPFLIVIILFHWAIGTAGLGIIVALRLLALVLLASFVTLTTRMDDMMAAIRPIFRPLTYFGLSDRRLALALALMIRFIPVLLGVLDNLDEAYRARSGKAGRWRIFAPFAIQALRLSDHVGEAISARGGADGLPDGQRIDRILGK